MDEMKIILKAGQIPVGSKVTKKTGSFVYLIKNTIRIFDEKFKDIRSGDDSRFLISSCGDINVIGSETEVVWLTDIYGAKRFIDNLLEEDN